MGKLQFSEFYRYPHLLHFGGLGDLAYQLASMEGSELPKISRRMREHNQLLLRDDDEFWSSAVQALSCAESSPVLSSELVAWMHGLPADPSCLYGLRGRHVPSDGLKAASVC